MPITTTLDRIREHSPCAAGWSKLLKHLGKTQADDEPLPFSVILDSNGLDDALWCCRAEPQHSRVWRHFAVDCAESVKHLMVDPRSLEALAVARRHADGCATDEELRDAARAARTAAWAAARAARTAAWAAAWAAADATWVDAAAWAAAATWADAARAAARAAFSKNFRGLVESEQ
jgi:hypothetical protein